MLQADYMDDYPLDGTIPYEVYYMDDSVSEMMSSVAAYYNVCPVDDPETNIICVNGQSSNDLFNTLAHEGCPGHMFQYYYFRNNNPDPARSVYHTLGYGEGWAVYASYDVLDKCDFGGIDNGKVYGQLLRINTDLIYLIHGRTDIGIHYEGWDMSDLENYLEKSGLNKEIAADLYEPIAQDPGVYLSYSFSYLEMLNLREKAEDELGSKFDAKEFHTAILDAGPCPFHVLGEKIDKYIEENK
jgi:uncharacterized protein (DUF885 family)